MYLSVLQIKQQKNVSNCVTNRRNQVKKSKGELIMNIITNTTITLSQNDVSDIIKQYLKTKGYTIADDMKIDYRITTRTEGFGCNEYPVKVFNNAFVEIETSSHNSEEVMNIRTNTTITLSKNEVSDIIKQYLKNKGYTIADDTEIDYRIATYTEGFGCFEHPVEVFQCALVKVETSSRDKNRR